VEGFCCPVPSETAPDLAKGRDLTLRLSHRVTQRDEPPHSCHLQLYVWPDNGGTMPSESTVLYTLVDPISPPSDAAGTLYRLAAAYGGGAGYRPRVRMVYYDGRLSP